jgi:hypothetical protein
VKSQRQMEANNDREKGQNGHATPPGNTGTAAADRTLKMQEKII